jgi:hypothetical protein
MANNKKRGYAQPMRVERMINIAMHKISDGMTQPAARAPGCADGLLTPNAMRAATQNSSSKYFKKKPLINFI